MPLTLWCANVTGYTISSAALSGAFVMMRNASGASIVSPLMVSTLVIFSPICISPPMRPPTYKFPLMPTPPDTINAPVNALVEGVIASSVVLIVLSITNSLVLSPILLMLSV